MNISTHGLRGVHQGAALAGCDLQQACACKCIKRVGKLGSTWTVLAHLKYHLSEASDSRLAW